MVIRKLRILVMSLLCVISVTAQGYEVTDRFSANGLAAAAGQCQFLAGNASDDGACRGAVPLGLQLDYKLTEQDLLNARLVILWGWNPAVTIQDPGTSLMLAKAREKGIKIVAVDPRYTDSAATFASQWVPIRPGTDSAVMIAIARRRWVSSPYQVVWRPGWIRLRGLWAEMNRAVSRMSSGLRPVMGCAHSGVLPWMCFFSSSKVSWR